MSLIKMLKYCGKSIDLRYSTMRIAHKLCTDENMVGMHLADKFKKSQYRPGHVVDYEALDGSIVYRYEWQDPSLNEIIKDEKGYYWSTYEGCTETIIEYIDEVFSMVTVKIYDGDTFNGYRTKLRNTFNIKISNEYLKFFSEMIKCDFIATIDDEHLEYLALQKLSWMNNRTKEILES